MVPLLAMLLAACAAGTPDCGPLPGAAFSLGTPAMAFTLFFGRAIPGRTDVTDEEWRAFLDDIVTPNLPDGYTVTDAEGAWLNPRTHRTERERTKVLLAVMPDTAASREAIARVRHAYEKRFQQQLVGMTAEPACVRF